MSNTRYQFFEKAPIYFKGFSRKIPTRNIYIDKQNRNKFVIKYNNRWVNVHFNERLMNWFVN